jgi:F0F1-type ATP synthase epsilon subunit
MKVRIVSLKGTEYKEEAKGAILKTIAGEITVLDHHLPIISVLKSGNITVLEEQGTRQDFFTTGGIIEVNQKNELVALID